MIDSLFVQFGFWTPVSIFIASLVFSSFKKKKTATEKLIIEENLQIPDLDGILK